MNKPPMKPLDQFGNWCRQHLLRIGIGLFLAGLFMSLLTATRLTIVIPYDQALLNQGVVMCGDTPMSTHGTCTIRECQSYGEHGFCVSDEIVAVQTRDQQKQWKEQSLTSEQQSAPDLFRFYGLMCSAGIVLLFWSLRERKKLAEPDIFFTSLSGQRRGTCPHCHTLDRPLHHLSSHEYSCPSCLRKLKQNQNR